MMFDLTASRVFQANPTPLRKGLFLSPGLLGAAAITWVLSTMDGSDHEPYVFAGGITALLFSLRFYFMQILGGPPRLMFATDGILVGKTNSSRMVAWGDLRSICYRAGRVGHYWQINSGKGVSLAFYVDGLTGRQQDELRKMIQSLDLPDVRVELPHDPLSRAA